jgi:hypothetical protein
MTYDERTLYAGLYQAYAWMQGAANAPLIIHTPDKYFMDAKGDDVGFDLKKFMAVVTDFDDGGIHYWRLNSNHEHGQCVLTLQCTEDDSMPFLSTDPENDDFRLAYHFVEEAEA